MRLAGGFLQDPWSLFQYCIANVAESKTSVIFTYSLICVNLRTGVEVLDGNYAYGAAIMVLDSFGLIFI